MQDGLGRVVSKPEFLNSNFVTKKSLGYEKIVTRRWSRYGKDTVRYVLFKLECRSYYDHTEMSLVCNTVVSVL